MTTLPVSQWQSNVDFACFAFRYVQQRQTGGVTHA